MTRLLRHTCLSVLLASAGACGPGDACDATADADGDTIDDCTEVDVLGTDPLRADSDADGFDDGEEQACGSDPLDVADVCYACGWHQDDPGDLVATGNRVGDTADNLVLVDQCGDEVKLWDFAQEYHILFLTASW
jgi:hypothetical protein